MTNNLSANSAFNQALEAKQSFWGKLKDKIMGTEMASPIPLQSQMRYPDMRPNFNIKLKASDNPKNVVPVQLPSQRTMGVLTTQQANQDFRQQSGASLPQENTFFSRLITALTPKQEANLVPIGGFDPKTYQPTTPLGKSIQQGTVSLNLKRDLAAKPGVNLNAVADTPMMLVEGITPIVSQGVNQVTQTAQQAGQPAKRVFSTAKYNMVNPGDGSMEQPPLWFVDLAEKYFTGEDVDKAVVTSLFESGYNPQAQHASEDGGVDRGLMQINENTFNEYMSSMPKTLARHGIYSFDDMWDPEKSMAMASIIVNSQKTLNGPRVDWDRWYGPAANGYNVYSSPDRYEYNRKAVEEWKRRNNG